MWDKLAEYIITSDKEVMTPDTCVSWLVGQQDNTRTNE